MNTSPRGKTRAWGHVLATILVGIASAAGQSVAGNWSIDVVQGSDRSIASNPRYSLAYDLSGNPSIAYLDGAASELRFVRHNGTSWGPAETVASIADVGWMIKVSLAYDSTGTPAVVFAEKTRNRKKRNLYYVQRGASAWEAPELVDRDIEMSSSSLAFDNSGNPSISYWKLQRTYFARRVGGMWQKEVVADCESTYATWLAYDPSDGRPAIAYLDLDFELGWDAAYIRYAKFNGSTWDIETVLSADGSQLGGQGLAFDPVTGQPSIVAASGGCPSESRLAERTPTGSWEETLTIQGNLGSPQIYNADGSLFLVLTEPCANDTIRLIKRTGTVWGPPQIIDAGALVSYSNYSHPSVALDPHGMPSLAYAYRVDGSNALRFAYSSQGCVADTECDDSAECTNDVCNAGSCENWPLVDDTPCTGGICCGGSCAQSTCTWGVDCDDGETCTTDFCLLGGSCAATCDHVIFDDGTGCGSGAEICCTGVCSLPSCQSDTDCDDDGDICTDEPCVDMGTCTAMCQHVFDPTNDPTCDSSCGEKNDPCNSDADCCSDRCKSNGRCG